IYGEIGPGERIALSKLAIENLETTGRPFRVAIDISIWQFQIQSGRGGTNPAIRTFYYRLLRLLSVSVQPLFVFDGPRKPPFKRNKRSGQHGATIPNLMCKQLLKLFGFPFHIAPGEAEAECALLQRESIVDAVLSEDVDTLMFGSGVTLRNWSSEGARGNKSPTHVSLYEAKATKEGKAGLDREGMVLIALMSGGDYITEGIPGAGIKVACEAARAGFGKSLCQLSRIDADGLDAWRQNLSHELQTNENKFFRCKHKSLKIPATFPNREVLAYYTHPVVSSSSKIQKLKDEITWDGEVDVTGLRLFVADAFDWTHKIGATKFIRGFAPVLLVRKLRIRGDRRDSGYGDLVLTAMNEMQLVRAICGTRAHMSSDGIPELRVIYHPNDIVGLDLEAEEDDSEDYSRDGLAPLNEDDDIEAYTSDAAAERSSSPTKRSLLTFDPTAPDKLWIPETIAKLGVPLKVEDYERSLRNPKKLLEAQAAAKKGATKRSKSVKSGIPVGALDKFVKVSKAGLGTASKSSAGTTDNGIASSKNYAILESKKRDKTSIAKPKPNTNPWTLATSSPRSGPTITKKVSQSQKSAVPSPTQANTTISMPSSTPLQSPSPPRKHLHSPLPESEPESNEPTLPHSSASIHLSPTPSNSQRLSPRKKLSTPKTLILESSQTICFTPGSKNVIPKSPTKISEKKQRAEKKNYIMLRESLPGKWSMEPEARVVKENRRAWRMSQIEVLDLTSE
ncbi:hypothetical protein BJ878DRAFT_427561, partial [Calycina marina]